MDAATGNIARHCKGLARLAYCQQTLAGDLKTAAGNRMGVRVPRPPLL